MSKLNLDMAELKIISDPRVAAVFDHYPATARTKMLALRKIILEEADRIETITTLEETLKWGEPSYIAKKGSTIRMDWKAKSPDQYALYFQCTSLLVPTFKMIYGNTLAFEGSRAIIFKLKEELPSDAVRHCVRTALTYHQVKHLPMLDM